MVQKILLGANAEAIKSHYWLCLGWYWERMVGVEYKYVSFVHWLQHFMFRPLLTLLRKLCNQKFCHAKAYQGTKCINHVGVCTTSNTVVNTLDSYMMKKCTLSAAMRGARVWCRPAKGTTDTITICTAPTPAHPLYAPGVALYRRH